MLSVIPNGMAQIQSAEFPHTDATVTRGKKCMDVFVDSPLGVNQIKGVHCLTFLMLLVGPGYRMEYPNPSS